jgi:hypothetical protein
MKKVLLPLLMLIVASSFLMAVESSPSAIVGYVKYPCVTTAGGLNFIALPMNSGYTNASDLGTAFPASMDAISFWDATTQTWTEADFFDPDWIGDFPVYTGMPLMINALGNFNFYSMGALPATTTTYSFIPGLCAMMVPLNQSALTTAAAVGGAVGILDAISFWDAPTQTWTEADFFDPDWIGDFDVTIGMPLMVNATGTATWPGAKNVKTLKASRASK